MTSRTATRRVPTPPRPNRARPSWAVWGGLIAAFAVVLVVGIAIALAADDDTDPNAEVFGPVQTELASLPTYDAALATDPAVGSAAPILLGRNPDGTGIEVGGAGRPTLVVFLAHWCPHCQAELPLLVDLAEAGAFEGLRTVAVLTGSNPDAPNFPPVDWLEREGWTGEVLLDDEVATAATAYGLAGYPFMVAMGADGNVVGRTSGEVPADEVTALAALALGQ
jgi:thiol-disulfide isomerase/thioredoxin